MLNDIKEVLYSEEELHEICERLGRQISEDYKDKNLLLVSVLKGSVVFMADLMRSITVPCRVDFMSVSSYDGTKTTGNVKIKLDLDINLVTINDFGGWDKAQETHFADGGIFDEIYEKKE